MQYKLGDIFANAVKIAVLLPCFNMCANSLGLDNEVKTKVHSAIAAKEGVEPKQSNLGKALRRRIDFVLSAASQPLPEL